MIILKSAKMFYQLNNFGQWGLQLKRGVPSLSITHELISSPCHLQPSSVHLPQLWRRLVSKEAKHRLSWKTQPGTSSLKMKHRITALKTFYRFCQSAVCLFPWMRGCPSPRDSTPVLLVALGGGVALAPRAPALVSSNTDTDEPSEQITFPGALHLSVFSLTFQRPSSLTGTVSPTDCPLVI